MDAVVEWVDARERLPKDGMPVAAATTGRYPRGSEAEPDDTESGQDFWLVMPMRFAARHTSEDGSGYQDCFIDSDRKTPGDETGQRAALASRIRAAAGFVGFPASSGATGSGASPLL